MRIGLVTCSFLPAVGGVEWKVHYLGTQYCQHRHDVTVFAERPRVTLGQIPIPVEHPYEVVRCGFPIPGFNRLGVNKWLFSRAIIRRHRQKPFDVLHCHHLGSPTAYGVAVKERTGVPVVATTCGADVQIVPEINYGVRLDPREDRIVRDNLQKIDVVGSISSSVRVDIDSMNPVARVVDIPNGVSWDEFQTGPSNLLREMLELDKQAVLVLSLGRNHIKKGYEAGIRAFAKVAPRYPNAVYAIVGRDTSALAPLVSELGMDKQIRLVDQVPMSDVPHVLHSADIFFNPSLVEGFAQVNAQALACGLPLVLTDAPGNRDAGDYGGAVIAKTGDVESMADAMEELIRDESARRRLANKAHQASRRFSWKTIAEQYLEVFESLIKGI